ncbi:SDR family NAD(P)-dependent oxidoreductase, partial [Bacillus thuringiensis]|uniref:SDR family NAD(P)-dependent oxidoreductase n=1 Tax=Bacillus thuringiensis TaxID=1428 RepID=UPI000C026128
GYALDVSDSNSINHTFEEIYNSDNKIDILINNAYFGAGKAIEEMTEWEWETGIDGSINNVFRVTKKALQYMLPKNKGNIINISSMYGVVSPDPSIYGDSGFNNPPNYGAGKAAII